MNEESHGAQSNISRRSNIVIPVGAAVAGIFSIALIFYGQIQHIHIVLDGKADKGEAAFRWTSQQQDEFCA